MPVSGNLAADVLQSLFSRETSGLRYHLQWCDCCTFALILTVAAVVVFRYRMTGNVFAYIAVWLLTMISMFSIGLMVASLCQTTKSMNVATSLLYFPMLLFSGATIPAEVFPVGLRAISRWMPLGVGIRLLKSVSIGCYDKMAMPVMTLIAIAVICGAIAVKTFRWE